MQGGLHPVARNACARSKLSALARHFKNKNTGRHLAVDTYDRDASKQLFLHCHTLQFAMAYRSSQSTVRKKPHLLTFLAAAYFYGNVTAAAAAQLA